jgi:tetratricopeptide (TPR) repeat protein
MVRKDKRARRPLVDFGEMDATPADLLARGYDRFEREDYTAAITAWEKILKEEGVHGSVDARLTVALAEAYFRRGVTSLPASIADLMHAADLAPGEPRYYLHVGHVYFERGDWEAAVEWYSPLVEGHEPYVRAVIPLAAALAALGVDITKHAVWQLLSEQDRHWFLPALALFRDKGPRELFTKVGDADVGGSFWWGLWSVWNGLREAVKPFEVWLSRGDLPPLCVGVGYYYLGVYFWQQGDPGRAAELWQGALESGLQTSWARHNFFVACQRLASDLIAEATQEGAPSQVEAILERETQQKLEQALQWAESGLLIVPDDKHLLTVKRYVFFRLGHSAAIAGDWEKAATYWQGSRDAGDTSRSLLINLAVASEKLGRYAVAADCWGQVVRRRPKRSDSPNSWSQEQVARMWRHVAENYRKVGDYEAATRTYRNAVKWAPEDVGLRLDLVEALMADGRPRAASTVVDEILKMSPDNVDALAWRATIYQYGMFYTDAQRLWHRVLELQPDHFRARMHIAGLHEANGDALQRLGRFNEARATYMEGLRYTPESPRLHSSIAVCYAKNDDTQSARQHFQQALEVALNRMDAYYWVIRGWMYLGRWKEVQTLIHQMEDVDPLPPGTLFVELAEFAAYLDRLEWVDYLLERAHSLEPENTHLLLEIALVLGENGQEEKAIDYLRRVLQLDPRSAIAHLWLGNYSYSLLLEPEIAEKHWTRAEELAHETNDLEVLLQMRTVRDIVRYQQRSEGVDDGW